MKRYLFFSAILGLFALLPISLLAQKSFDFNPRCQLAYQQIIQLKLKAGQDLIDQEKKANPDNLIPYFLENYIDFFILFFNEDPADYKSRKDGLEKRLALMNGGPENSPFYLFTKSIIRFQWAAVKIKFGYSWDAGWEFRRSFLESKENVQAFPSFSPEAMLHGAMLVVAGTIPDGYRWLASLLNIKGTIRGGMKELEQFIGKKENWATLFHDEAVFYWLYLKYYIQNQKEEALAYISDNKLDVKDNLLFTFLAANLAVNNQRSAYARGILLEKNNSPEYFDTPVWDLEMGWAAMNHLDADAVVYLERFSRRFKGKFYLKEVLQKISWYYYLKGDEQRADEYRHAVIERGNTVTEADKLALKEAKTGLWPDKLLLRARLLNDGGYHLEALQWLNGKSSNDFSMPAEKTEYNYRLARIYDDMGKRDQAIAAYLSTIRLGEQQKEYFAARAALQLGYLYEKSLDTVQAIGYFQKCLAMKDHDYKNSLDQKAKAGIARCKGD
jgi:hypothetical protein